MDRKICVYTSSSTALDKRYYSLARELGESIARCGDSLVFGAGIVGMMGALADGVKDLGGVVYGIIPEKLNIRGIVYERCDSIEVTPDMHTRKRIMEELADAFVVLPGGFGTLDELCEILTLKQLGYFDKPIAIINFDGYFDGIIAQFGRIFDGKFAKREYESYYRVAGDVKSALEYIDSYKPSGTVKKWF